SNVLTGSATASMSDYTITAQDVYLSALRDNTIFGLALGVSFGLAGAFSGAFVLNYMSGETTASVENCIITADTVLVQALDESTLDNLVLQVAGALYAMSAGTAVSIIKGDVVASVDDSEITTTKSMTVLAENEAVLTQRAIGIAVGGYSAGLMMSIADISGNVSATVTGSTLSGGANSIEALGEWDSYSFALAGSAGILAGSATIATSTIGGIVNAAVTDSTIATVASLSVLATARNKATAISIAPAVSMLAGVGIAIASATSKTEVTANATDLTFTTDTATNVGYPDVSVKAVIEDLDGGPSVRAEAFALGTGVAVGAAGALSTAVSTASASAHFSTKENTDAILKSLTVHAENTTTMQSDAMGIGIGGHSGLGATLSVLDADSETDVQVSAGGIINIVDDLDVLARGEVITDQESVAGSGAVVTSVAASTVTSNIVSDTDVTIAGTIKVDGDATIESSNIADITRYNNGVSVALVSGGGAGTYGETTLDADVTFADGASLTANTMTILAENDIIRDSLTKATAAGAIAVSAGGITEDSILHAAVTIGDNASLTATGADTVTTVTDETGISTSNTDRVLQVAAFNRADTSDVLTFNSGGVVSATEIGGTVSSDFTTDITLGENASLTTTDVSATAGGIQVEVGTYEAQDVSIASSLYGGASTGIVMSRLYTDSTNTITMEKGSSAYATGDAMFFAGKATIGNVTEANSSGLSLLGGSTLITGDIGDVDTSLTGDIYDNTTAPGSYAGGGLYITLDSDIIVEAGASVQARGSVEMGAQRGTTSESSYISARNWINSAVQLTDKSNREREISQDITIAGTVESGVDNVIEVTLSTFTWQWWTDNEDSLADDNATKLAIEALYAIGFNDEDLASIFDAEKDIDTRAVEFSTALLKYLTAEVGSLSDISAADFIAYAATAGLSTDEQLAFALLELAGWDYDAIDDLDISTLLTTDGVDIVGTVTEILNSLDFSDISDDMWQIIANSMASADSTVATNFASYLSNLLELSDLFKLSETESAWDYLESIMSELSGTSFTFSQLTTTALEAYIFDVDNWNDYDTPESFSEFSNFYELYWNLKEYSFNSGLQGAYSNSIAELKERFEAIEGVGSFDAIANSTDEYVWLECFLTVFLETSGGVSYVYGSYSYLMGYTNDAPSDTSWINATYTSLRYYTATDFVTSTLTTEQNTLLSKYSSYLNDMSGLYSGLYSLRLYAYDLTEENVSIPGYGYVFLKQFSDVMNYLPDAFWYALAQNEFSTDLTDDEIKVLTTWNACGSSSSVASFTSAQLSAQTNLLYAIANIKLGTSYDWDSIFNDLTYIATGVGSETVSIDWESIDASALPSVVNEYLALQTLSTELSTDDVAYAEVVASMAALEDQLVDIGYGTKITDDEGNTVFSFQSSTIQEIMSVQGITLQQGNITFNADTVTIESTGKVEAHTEASITIINNTSQALAVGDMVIESTPSGNIYTGLSELIIETGGAKIEGTTSTPSITITQNASAALYVTDDITNIKGIVTMYSNGDLTVAADVFAATLSVTSLGTITIRPDGDFYNVGGIPANITTENAGSLKAIGDIIIEAEYINVNGTIQSGVSAWTLDLDSTDMLDESTVVNTVINTDGTATIGYTWDADSETFTLNDILATGGTIYLVGEVINTNEDCGFINVYTNPDIIINNESTATIVVGEINTGSTDTGRIVFYDSGWENGTEMVGDFTDGTWSGWYEPESTAVYSYITGTTTGNVATYVYVTREWLGMDFMAKDIEDFDLESYIVLADEPLSGAGFITDDYDVLSIDVTKSFLLAEIASAVYSDRIEYEREGLSSIIVYIYNDGYGGFDTYDFEEGTLSGKVVTYTIELDSDEQTWVEEEKIRLITEYSAYRQITTTNQTITWYMYDTNQIIGLNAATGDGTVTITSVGDIRLSGTIDANSDIVIESTGGNITQDANTYITSEDGDISLTASGTIGLASTSEDNDHSRVTVVASIDSQKLTISASSAYIEILNNTADTGAYANIDATIADTLDIKAHTGLAGSASASVMNVESSSGFGTSDDFFDITKSGVTLDVSAMDGVYVNVADTSDDTASLFIDQLYSKTGDVHVTATGSLYDANTVEEMDQADVDRMSSVWEQLGILIEGLGEEQKAELLASECAQLTSIYHQYWTSQESMYASYGTSDEILAAAETLSALDSTTLTDDELALMSFAEMIERLNDFDASLITDAYNDAYTIAATALTAEQQALLEARFAGSLWTEDELMAGNGLDIYDGTTTTMRTEEANIVGVNVVLQAGGNIGAKSSDTSEDTLDDIDAAYYASAFNMFISSDEDNAAAAAFAASGYSYMEFTAEQLMPSNLMDLSLEEQMWIWSSEATDRYTYVNDAGETITRIYGTEDLNISASGTVAVYADGYALIGSGLQDLGISEEQSMTISAAVAGGELRVKADGDLMQSDTGYSFDDATTYHGFYAGISETYTITSTGLASASGLTDDEINGYLVVESSNGSLGSIIFDDEGGYTTEALNIKEHDAMTVRAYGDIVLNSIDENGDATDLNIDRLNKEATSYLWINAGEETVIQGSDLVFDATSIITTDKLTVVLTESGAQYADAVEEVIEAQQADTSTRMAAFASMQSAAAINDVAIIDDTSNDAETYSEQSVTFDDAATITTSTDEATVINVIGTDSENDSIIITNSTADKTITLGTVEIDGVEYSGTITNTDGEVTGIGSQINYADVENISTGDMDDTAYIDDEASLASLDLSGGTNTVYIIGSGSVDAIISSGDVTFDASQATADLVWEFVDGVGSLSASDGTTIIANMQVNPTDGSEATTEIQSGYGNDTITVTNTDLSLINARGGDDTIIISNSTVDTINSSKLDGENDTATSDDDTITLNNANVTTLITGEGDDSVTMTGGSVESIDMGTGSNTVMANTDENGDAIEGTSSTIGTLTTDGSGDIVELSNAIIESVAVGNNAASVVLNTSSVTDSLTIGDGAGTVSVAGSTISGDMTVGANATSVELTGSTVTNDVIIGANAETVNVDNTSADTVSIAEGATTVIFTGSTISDDMTVGAANANADTSVTLANTDVTGALETGNNFDAVTIEATGETASAIGSISIGDNASAVGIDNVETDTVSIGEGAGTVSVAGSTTGDVTIGDKATSVELTDSEVSGVSIGANAETVSVDNTSADTVSIAEGATTVIFTGSTISDDMTVGAADSDVENTSVTLTDTNVTGALETGNNFDAVTIEATGETASTIGSISIGDNASAVGIDNVETDTVSIGEGAGTVSVAGSTTG
ncbi:MAG: hypothetical protein R3Y11_09910, partial [Pseudomonadota bacterium]